MNKKLKDYFEQINEISHITLDPKGPGVVRIHLIPPKKPKLGVSWVAIINGYAILPLTCGWAILLREFIKEATSYNGIPLGDNDISNIIKETIRNVKKIFPKTSSDILKKDLNEIISTFVDIAKNKEVSSEIGYMTLAKYGKFMQAPHRMDLMISAMTKNGSWNCNQKCMHCYACDQKLSDEEELATKEWKKIIDKCQKACIPQLTFTGGEPTLRSDLVELINHASWFVTRLNTNGVLLTKTLCKELYEASLDSVQVTLYSSDKDIHNKLVGKSNFEKTVEGIKNAVEAGLNVSINTPLCDLNKNYLSTIKFAQKLGITYFTCSGLIMTGSSTDDNAQKTYLSEDQLLEILTEVVNYADKNDLEINFTSPGWLKEKDLKRLHQIVPSCGACLSNMAITPNGNVIPCQSWLNDQPLGSMLNDSWKSIWNNKVSKKIRKQICKMEQICPLSQKAKEEK